jgi:DNA polymerase-3 subunit epsilon
MRLSQLVRSIEVKPTGGELGALLLESTLIKKHQPIFNKRLRKTERLIMLKKSETKDGFLTFELSTASFISVDDIDNLSGIFKSMRDAKKFLIEFAKRYNLCPKLLGLEKTKTSCFSYQLNQCRGACIGKESKLSYNLRFTEGFSKYRIKTWPFENAILIEDGHRNPERFVVDKWCLLGRLNETEELEQNNEGYMFDFDIYKILSRFILSGKNQKHIKNYKLSA